MYNFYKINPVKCKVVPVLLARHHAYGRVEVQLHIFLTLMLNVGDWSLSRCSHFIHG